MSRLDELPPDLHAALAVLLRSGKRYQDVAAMLGIAERAVHDRAHAALALLAPREARALDAPSRELIGDYLLGQHDSADERQRARTLLASSAGANAWARAVAAELAAEAPSGLPEIPALTGDDAAAAAGGPRSSRLGGALLLVVIVAAVAVAIVLLTKGGGEKKHAAAAASSASTATSGASTGTSGSGAGTTGATGSTGTSKAGAKAHVVATFALKSPSAESNSKGSVRVLAEGSTKAFFIEAERIPSTSGFFYAVWLYNSPTSALALSKAPSVGSSHKLAGAALLPSNAGEYHEILLTQETSTKPTHPGKIVLRGSFGVNG